MIRNQWYAVLNSKQVKKNKLIGVTRLSEKLVFWRGNAGEVYCIYDKCCHRGASLCTGTLVKNRIQCPFHGFLYDDSGKVTSIPANGKNATIAENYRVNAYPRATPTVSSGCGMATMTRIYRKFRFLKSSRQDLHMVKSLKTGACIIPRNRKPIGRRASPLRAQNNHRQRQQDARPWSRRQMERKPLDLLCEERSRSRSAP